MNKQVEQIKAEIVRRMKETQEKRSIVFSLLYEGMIKEDKELLTFIDSLPVPEEPSIPDIVDKHFWEMLGEELSEDLEKASEKSATHQYYNSDRSYIAENEKENSLRVLNGIRHRC